MKTAVKKAQSAASFEVEPVLRRVLVEAEQEHRQLQETFSLMGWEDLPDTLKMEIKDDVSAMVDELQGRYSTNDPNVLRRRESVTWWVNCYREGICSLETAIGALRVRKL